MTWRRIRRILWPRGPRTSPPPTMNVRVPASVRAARHTQGVRGVPTSRRPRNTERDVTSGVFRRLGDGVAIEFTHSFTSSCIDVGWVRAKVSVGGGVVVSIGSPHLTVGLDRTQLQLEVARKLTEDVTAVGIYSLTDNDIDLISDSLRNADFLAFGRTIFGIMYPQTAVQYQVSDAAQLEFMLEADPELCFFTTELEVRILSSSVSVQDREIPVDINGTIKLHFGLSPAGYYAIAKKIGGWTLHRYLKRQLLSALGISEPWARLKRQIWHFLLQRLGFVFAVFALTTATAYLSAWAAENARYHGRLWLVIREYTRGYVIRAYRDRFPEYPLPRSPHLVLDAREGQELRAAWSLGWHDSDRAIRFHGARQVRRALEERFTQNDYGATPTPGHE